MRVHMEENHGGEDCIGGRLQPDVSGVSCASDSGQRRRRIYQCGLRLYEYAFEGAEYIVISTPTNYDDELNYFDTSSVEDVIEKVISMGIDTTMVVKSTIPVGFIESVKKTGKIVLASDACERGSHLKDFAQSISELAFDYLDAPPVVVGARNMITPCHEMEDCFFPQPSWIIDAIHEKIVPIQGYVPENGCTEAELYRRAKNGV